MGWAGSREEGGSRHGRPTISQHKQLRASGRLGPLSPLLRCLFLFGQLRHIAGVGPAATGRVSVVCRKDVTRLQERRVTKWRTIVLSAQRDTGSDSQEDGIISSSDKSLTGPKAAAVCERACLSSAAYFTYRVTLESGAEMRKDFVGTNEQVKTKRCKVWPQLQPIPCPRANKGGRARN